jgi:histidinol-phosphate aminotransferase
MKRAANLVRPLVHQLHSYVPGEQPKIHGLVKLNTNENPYPPSPKVIRAIKAATDARLRLYPDPVSSAVREKLARLHRCDPANVIVGNGSDELLALAVRTFVEPDAGCKRNSACTVQYFTPSYSLYPVLAATQSHGWDFDAALTLITTPNAPSGRGCSTDELEKLGKAHRGVVLLDEAYVDFAPENAMSLALEYPHVIVARTFSKAYSLCFQRVGYCVAHSNLIAALDKMRDSYNVNGLGQVAAAATLDDLPYYRRNFARVIATRDRMAKQLTDLAFEVFPSATNFLLVRPPGFPAEQWLQKLRDHKVLVRWFRSPEVSQYLRITVGTDKEADALLRAVRKILK